MLQTLAVRPRRHLLSVALVAFGALALLSVPKLNLASAPAPAEPPAAVVEAAVVPASNAAYIEHGCGAGAGAYVTGDMVGDASPAAVYATLCGR
jgi:hypothetical protein